MIAGLLVIITLIVIRFRDPGPDLPNSLVLPNGTEALAFTQTGRWYAVVTEDDRILVFSRATGTLMREIQISRD
ncbi:hypothetical protein SAMN04488092_11928 [Thalassovita taeanensis]|uniref:Uncharacterized protein n=2 Tax=Thalassovita taeanensis TaxID=657014 RepID=A0A1H9KL59_9RHOB|nr:hypothetical protein SAMN04488092_11928 [Thalassovita taeanensis]